ncbi:MAG TPA: hypothetical protein VM529_18070 [Gemmata sp.]|jgi:hypothetical protein|nr:hypothetical protein [Gemmata sp.]
MTPEEAMKLVAWNDQSVCDPIDDEATAANILAAIRAAVLDERERCAKVCEEFGELNRPDQLAFDIARCIREGTP